MMDAGDLTEGGRNRAADHEASDARHARSIARAEGLGEEEPGRVVTADPAAVHLAAMRDLAGRILAMGRTLESRETGKPTVAVWDLGRELAELVSHYEPATFGEEHPQSEAMLGALSWARTALDDPASVPNEMFAPYRAHLGGTAYYKAEADVRVAFAIDRIDDAMQAIQGKEA